MDIFKRLIAQSLVLSFLLMTFNGVVALTAVQVYQKVKSSIYTLISYNFFLKREIGRGTAVAVGKNILATNCHVALSGNYLVAKVKDKPLVGKLIYKNENEDLCLLKIPNATFNPVKIRPSNNVKIGENVYAVGNPTDMEKTLSKGIISNKVRVKGGMWLETDAAIYYGSSGGGLFDDQGQLIGITSKMGGHFGFALPTEWVLSALTTKHQGVEQNQNAISVAGDEKPFKQPVDYSRAYANLKLLGVYGKGHVRLYRNNNECFLSFFGYTGAGKSSMSVALWNPTHPQNLVIFATASTVKDALAKLYQSVIESQRSKLESFISGSLIEIGNNPFRLYGARQVGHPYMLYIAHFIQNPYFMLEKENQFTVRFDSDKSTIGTKKVVYKLDGIEEAIANHQKLCSKN